MISINSLTTVLCLITAVELKLIFHTADNIDNLVQYEYKYRVDEGHKSGPVMDRWERRLGEYVKGAYSVLQPDGSVRTVDYEVDGERGYHAITRLTPPSSDYLSSQQLIQAQDIFQPSPLSASTKIQKPEVKDEIINYHSLPPYINKREFNDHKTSASTNIAVAAQATKTPVNFNSPFSQKLIYYKTPAGKVSPEIQIRQDIFNIDALLPKTGIPSDIIYKNGITAAITKSLPGIASKSKSIDDKTPVKRHSKLVKRFNSFDEVFL